MKGIRMTREEFMDKAYELAHYNELTFFGCSQAVVATFQELLRMPDPLAFKAASSFAGGISHQYLTCGALLGGIMIISMRYGRGENREDFEALQNGMELANKLMFKFKQEFGTLNCRDITGIKGNSLEEAQEYSRSGLHDERCPIVCGKTARMVAEILDEKEAELLSRKGVNRKFWLDL